MNIRTILYCVTVPIIIWALESLNLNNLFKKNRYYQARILYVVIALSLSYLLVNFFMDFFISTQIR